MFDSVLFCRCLRLSHWDKTTTCCKECNLPIFLHSRKQQRILSHHEMRNPADYRAERLAMIDEAEVAELAIVLKLNEASGKLPGDNNLF